MGTVSACRQQLDVATATEKVESRINAAKVGWLKLTDVLLIPLLFLLMDKELVYYFIIKCVDISFNNKRKI